MASATASIPRFLLPQSGLIWRRVVAGTPAPSPSVSASASRRIFIRLASSNSKSGPHVLEKPERFNPPSHGARLPKKTTPRHYGGDLNAEEIKIQAQTDYPMMMAPKGTRAYWFWHSRWIHVIITVGTLSGLAIWTFALSFRETSPFADMLPAASDFLWHPFSSTRMLIEVLRLHEAHKSASIDAKRKRYVEDVTKRAAYRKAHGLPEAMGLFNQPMAKFRTEEDEERERLEAAEKAVDEVVRQEEEEGQHQQQQGDEEEGEVAAAGGQSKKDGVRRLTEDERQTVVKEAKQKWLGIF